MKSALEESYFLAQVDLCWGWFCWEGRLMMILKFQSTRFYLRPEDEGLWKCFCLMVTINEGLMTSAEKESRLRGGANYADESVLISCAPSSVILISLRNCYSLLFIFRIFEFFILNFSYFSYHQNKLTFKIG